MKTKLAVNHRKQRSTSLVITGALRTSPSAALNIILHVYTTDHYIDLMQQIVEKTKHMFMLESLAFYNESSTNLQTFSKLRSLQEMNGIRSVLEKATMS